VVKMPWKAARSRTVWRVQDAASADYYTKGYGIGAACDYPSAVTGMMQRCKH
jgi:hypothetical protein